MPNVVKIHASKQPRRPHYIQDWADKYGMKQADLAEQLGADKSLVSRWYSGSSPGKEWQRKLAALFDCDEDAIFRPPEDDWMRRFFEGRKREEIERIMQSMEIAFPRPQKSK